MYGTRSKAVGIASRLNGGRSGVRIQVVVIDFSPLQKLKTVSGSHAASVQRVSEFFPGSKAVETWN
jgi:hypothetical protein